MMAVAQGPLGEDRREGNGGEIGGEKGEERGEEKSGNRGGGKGGKRGEEKSRVISGIRGSATGGDSEETGGGSSKEEIEGSMNYPIKASTCFFVPFRNLLPSLMRKEVDTKFPPDGLVDEDIMYDIDEMELKYELLKKENENCNLFDKNNCEKCFSVCCII